MSLVAELKLFCVQIIKRLYAIETPKDVIACERASKTIGAIEREEKSKEKHLEELRQLSAKLADDAEVASLMGEVETLHVKMDDTRQQQLTYLELANDMLLFLRDADVVDGWLRTQQATNTTLTIGEQVDLETCEKEIHDLEKKPGQAKAFEERVSGLRRTTTIETEQKNKCSEQPSAEVSTPEGAMKSDIQTTVVEEPVEEEEPDMNGTAVSLDDTNNGDVHAISPLNDSTITKSDTSSSNQLESRSSKPLRGHVNRKLLVVNGKQSKDRSWNKVYAIVENGAAKFYKDKKQAKADFSSSIGAIKLSREQHHKKSFVLKVDLADCQFLMETDNQSSMETWITALGADAETISTISCASPSLSTKSGTTNGKSKRRSLFSKIKK